MKSTTVTAAVLAILAAFGFSRAQYWKGQALQNLQTEVTSAASASAPEAPTSIYLGESQPVASAVDATPNEMAVSAPDVSVTNKEIDASTYHALLAEVTAYRQEKAEAEIKEAEAQKERAERNARREAERQKWRTERSQRASSNIVSQVELFTNFDTRYFTPEQQAAFNGMMETLEILNQKMLAYSTNPEGSSEIRKEMHDLFPVLREQMAAGREVLMQDMFVNDLGFTTEEAKAVTEDIEFIRDMTSMRSLMRGVWGRGGGSERR